MSIKFGPWPIICTCRVWQASWFGRGASPCAQLTAHIDSYGQESDITKESFLINQQAVVNSFSNEVYNDPSLLAHEKQVVLATVLLNANIIALTIEYGEELQDGYNHLKNSCNWWCRTKFILECSAWSIVATSACAATVNTPSPVTIAYCVIAAIKAINCRTRL